MGPSQPSDSHRPFWGHCCPLCPCHKGQEAISTHSLHTEPPFPSQHAGPALSYCAPPTPALHLIQQSMHTGFLSIPNPPHFQASSPVITGTLSPLNLKPVVDINGIPAVDVGTLHSQHTPGKFNGSTERIPHKESQDTIISEVTYVKTEECDSWAPPLTSSWLAGFIEYWETCRKTRL